MTFTQDEREYTLKPAILEVKEYYGILTRRLAILQTKELGDTDLDVLEKYEKDLAKFELNILQIDEACEDLELKATQAKTPEERDKILERIPKTREKRNYDSLKANYEACKADFEADRVARRQKELREGLYARAFLSLVMDEKLIMDILPKILEGDVSKITYDVKFATEVILGFFLFAGRTIVQNASKGNMIPI